jgi:hypothetical protein
MTKLTMTSNCTSIAANFDGLADAPEGYRWHCPIRRVQGYYGSHWTLALGDYLLRIAPAAARATGIQTTINKHTCKDGHFMAMAMHQYVTVCIAQWRRSRASIEATGCRHRASITPNNMVGTWLRWFFSMFSLSKP